MRCSESGDKIKMPAPPRAACGVDCDSPPFSQQFGLTLRKHLQISMPNGLSNL
ncbi:hypothetical protein CFBP5877_18360 [Agrobacterium tumefaciens]|uniref:Uncharacterized protein n=1 Tax=Agrobacterium tumefaciens TaxID=358 RepID=A0AAE6EHU7_AGRTU|nr:hypothetical protein CFBP5499_18820 [Agrobacterium tumefaciens]QCL82277.1 hypothetical protein CFBP5877_18360 [Agrobacterium tumefaciens]